MRGFKKSISDTDAAYASGKLTDSKRRSFVSQPKLTHGVEPCSHLILYGADRTAARMALFRRQNSKCEVCAVLLVWGGEGHDGMAGEMMHLLDGLGQKCDCPQNISLRCNAHHQGPGTEHYKRRPRWGADQDVRLMPGETK